MSYRFWVYLSGSPVRLSLRPGESIEHSRGGPDSEGWARESVIWKHTGAGVYCEGLTEGRDCDGYSSRWWDTFCPADQLAAGIELDGVRFPRWQDSTVECRDEHAESMGY